jgi:hypothetical protein
MLWYSIVCKCAGTASAVITRLTKLDTMFFNLISTLFLCTEELTTLRSKTSYLSLAIILLLALLRSEFSHFLSMSLLALIISTFSPQVAAIFPISQFTLVDAIIKMYDWNLVWKLVLVFENGQDVSSLAFEAEHVALFDSSAAAVTAVVSGNREAATSPYMIVIQLSTSVTRLLAKGVTSNSIKLTAASGFLRQNGVIVGTKVEEFSVRVVPVGMFDVE